jgi:hypothetical protein
VLTSLADVSDIIVLQVQDSLGVLDNGRRVRSNEELDGLRKTVLGQEGSRLRSSKLGFTASSGNSQKSTTLGIVGDCRWLRNDQLPDENNTVDRVQPGRTLLRVLGSGKFDINEVDLELPVSLDTDQERRSSSSGNDLVREVLRLEDESEGPFLMAPHGHRMSASSTTCVQDLITDQFLDDRLDQVGEVQPLGRLRVVNVLAENGDGFGVGIGVESVSSLLKNELDFLVYAVVRSVSHQAVGVEPNN